MRDDLAWAAAYHGKRVAITGGTGFLGAALKADLRHASSVMPLRRQDGWESWTRSLDQADFLFHLAAQTSLEVAELDPQADWQANVFPIVRILEYCRQRTVRPIIVFAGTVTEAGLHDRLPANEDAPDKPVTIYDVHKLAAEHYLGCYARQGIVQGATLRLANVYGPGPAATGTDRGILNQTIGKAIRGETLTVYGDGCELRDYLFVEDAVRAFLAAGACMERLNGNSFVIATGSGCRIVDAVHLVAEIVEQRTGRRVPMKHIPPPAGASPIQGRNFVGDSSRLRRLTGWSPRIALREGVTRTVDHLLKGSSTTPSPDNRPRSLSR